VSEAEIALPLLLKALRGDRSPAEVARAAGVEVNTLHAWEATFEKSWYRRVPARRLLRLLELYDINPDGEEAAPIWRAHRRAPTSNQVITLHRSDS
jgi:hypothetical protein